MVTQVAEDPPMIRMTLRTVVDPLLQLQQLLPQLGLQPLQLVAVGVAVVVAVVVAAVVVPVEAPVLVDRHHKPQIESAWFKLLLASVRQENLHGP